MRVDPVPKGTKVCWQTGKYEMTRQEAKKVAKRMQKREGSNMIPYLCAGCGMWHVGKSIKGRT